ncbi:MAG TPA: hypothetical protein VHI10_18155 [Mycobacterium sp.]|nr:hypothetical protein [Mycobacterium sp.]
MTAPQSRPRVVTAAFWFWVATAAFLVAFGLLMAFSPDELPAFFRGAGALFAVAGLTLSYLAGRARVGDIRFRRAGIALALTLVLLLALFSLTSGGVIWLVAMVLAMVGAVLIMRPSAQDWYDRAGQP